MYEYSIAQVVQVLKLVGWWCLSGDTWFESMLMQVKVIIFFRPFLNLPQLTPECVLTMPKLSEINHKDKCQEIP